MRTSYKVLLSTAVAVTLFAALTASASANRLSISNQNIRAVWTPIFIRVSEALEFTCVLTLEGSFHSRTFAKSIGTLIGHITRARVEHPCTTGMERLGEWWVHNGTEAPLGGAAPATSLPWHMTYRAFSGTLPRISEVRILLRGIRTTLALRLGAGIICLAVYGEVNESIISEWLLNPTNGTVNQVTFLSQPLNRRETIIAGFCPERILLNSSATTVTLLGNTTAISIRLI